MSIYRKYTCTRCDVTWRAEIIELIPDTCWMCEKNDSVTVWTQVGLPVEIHGGPNADNAALRQWVDETRRNDGP